jgi:hypothetical protein
MVLPTWGGAENATFGHGAVSGNPNARPLAGRIALDQGAVVIVLVVSGSNAEVIVKPAAVVERDIL